jgi:hypothetical protein
MFNKYAGVTIDFYDDKGATLREHFPLADQLPDVIKTANIVAPEVLANEDFALIAVDGPNVLRKFACNDAGTTAMSVIYFMDHGDKLPLEAQKLAAENLISACTTFGLEPTEQMRKIAQQAPVQSKPQREKTAGFNLSPFSRALLAGAAGGAAGGAVGSASQGGDVRDAVRGAGIGAVVGAGTIGLMQPSGLSSGQTGTVGALHGFMAGRSIEKEGSAYDDAHALGLDRALKEHESRETSKEEMQEQLTCREAHPAPPFKVAHITGKSAPVKLASQRPRAVDDYAVVVDGKPFYPIDTWDNIKTAEAYMLENRRSMEPELRHQYATKLAAKAQKMGYKLASEIQEMGSPTYAQEEHMKMAIDMRAVAFPRRSQERAMLDELFEKRADIHPEIYAQTLKNIDLQFGLASGWDNVILDPWSSTFGKQADTVVWQEGLDRVTASELHNLALNHSQLLRTKFTTDFVNEFEKDPVAFFEALPNPHKKIFARLADDLAHNGGSESLHITADKKGVKSVAAAG